MQKTKNKVKQHLIFVLLTLLLLLADQFTKHLAVIELRDKGRSIPLIEDVLSFTYLENRGAAFGLLQNARYFFIALTIAVMIGCGYYYIKKMNESFMKYPFALLLLMAGAIGNLIDRIRFGYVVDFISLDIIHFPIFNVADIFVTLAAAYFAYLVISEENAASKKGRKEAQHHE
ncbi:MAG: signal peptidase II [Eubacteriales bacterium]|nr:signal peptidase II [Eubacteriales bacterium]